MLLYIGVAWVSLANAENEIGSLANLAEEFSGSMLGKVMLVAAAIAMVSVLLNLVLGLSRVVLAMGRRGDLPKATAHIREASSVPTVATAVVGVLIAGLVCLGDLKLTWTFSAFTVLVYYALTNLCALRLQPESSKGRLLSPRSAQQRWLVGFWAGGWQLRQHRSWLGLRRAPQKRRGAVRQPRWPRCRWQQAGVRTYDAAGRSDICDTATDTSSSRPRRRWVHEIRFRSLRLITCTSRGGTPC